MKEAKIKLCKNSMTLSSQMFMKMPVELAIVYKETMEGMRLFQSKFDAKFLLAEGGDIFKRYAFYELDQKVNQWPLSHRYFVAA